MTGHVKNFNQERGFGFIRATDGNEYFLHCTRVAKGTPYAGARVEFEIEEQSDGRWRAVRVIVLDRFEATS